MISNHVAVGFYPNMDFKVNIVADEDLQSNIEYNKLFRPGRVYFVDGEYACGGIMKEPYKSDFIRKCKAKIAQMNIDATKVTIPYV